MPVALLAALMASLGLHAVALFGTHIELATEVEPIPVLAELRPIERPPPVPVTVASAPAQSGKKGAPGKGRPKEARATPAPVTAESERGAPEPLGSPVGLASEHELAGGSSPEPVATESEQAPAHQIPERGIVNYRVERGDQGFEIGFARHSWHIAEGRYRIQSLLETTGLAWLVKSVRIEMESRGQMTANGLRPDEFNVRRNGSLRERAAFDWQAMTVRVGDRSPVPVQPGAQDLLSFNYQLGYLPALPQGETLALATGKKYGLYRLEVIGEETLELPVGTMRTLHLRAPGVNTTELWLAYDYLMLPVKIRHLDSQGDSLVQVATEIQMSPE